MCDSDISECCPMDFTNYCPVISLKSEAKEQAEKSQQNHITWFSRKTMETSLKNKHLSHEEFGTTVSSHSRKNVDPERDEDYRSTRYNSRSLEKASSYVSQEELNALKGCVMRRRAVFSPSPSSSPVHSLVHKQPQAPNFTNSLPTRRRQFTKNDDVSHVRQSSLEYDHLQDFEPRMDTRKMTDSVSVQFRLQGYSESNDNIITSCGHQDSSALRHSTLANSIPDRLDNSRHVTTSQGLHQSCHQYHSCSCDLHLTGRSCNAGTCSCWQRNQLSSENTQKEPVLERKSSNAFPTSHNSRIQLHYSPFHSKYNSPVLSKHQVYSCEGSLLGGMKTYETGSNYSLYSQTTTASSLADRQHCSYSTGVDGNLFKDRTENVLAWFSEFSDQQRNMMLMKLLEQCDCAQMHFLSVQMEPILHEGCPHNCQDFLTWLPFNIAMHIFSFLDPVSLCQASAVSKDWYHAATQPNLWKRLCKVEKWKLSVSGELKYQSRFLNIDGSIRWKYLFAEKFRLRRNWLKGYCTVRTFEGHTQGISCIQFDDTRIVSGSSDKTIKVWNRRTNTVWAALTLAGHSGTVRCLHLHNNRLVSGSSDRTIKVWDLATDKVGWVGAACRATMVGHMHTVRCLQADDEKVISGSYDQTLKIWDVKTGQCQKTLRGHTDAVLCLQFDEHKVVSGSKDKTIKIWSLPDGLCKLTFHGHEAAVSCLHFDDTRIISGALDRLIKIWNLTKGECIRTIDWIKSEGHTGVIRHLQADSWKIISAADDKTLKVWNVHTGNRLLTLKSHTDGVTCLQFNNEVIVSGSYDKTVKLWDFSSC